jgi:co-chaperonin GroES (HSP10)
MSIRTIKAKKLQPLKNKVFVEEMESGPTITSSGLILPDDNMKESGVKPRWSKVYAVGPDVDDLKPGDWVLTKHARWSLGIDLELEDRTVRIWQVEYPESVELVSEEDPRTALPTVL